LYEELIVQYLKSSNEAEAAEKAPIFLAV